MTSATPTPTPKPGAAGAAATPTPSPTPPAQKPTNTNVPQGAPAGNPYCLDSSAVDRLYTVLLGRPADPVGAVYWRDLIAFGTLSCVDVVGGIRSSAEYQARGGSLNSTDAANAERIEALYLTVLNRNSDPGGLAYWVGQMRAGMAYSQVEAGFLNSAEFANRRVLSPKLMSVLYEAFLGRPLDAAGAVFWESALTVNGLDTFGVQQGIVSSQEAGGNGGVSGVIVNALYQVILGRDPDAAGHSYWAGLLNAGTPLKEVALEILTSPEALNRQRNHCPLKN